MRVGPPEVVEAVALRTAEIVRALSDCSEAELVGSSELSGWSRLTIACHLRYGAEASERMTTEAFAGEPVAFYPEGRSGQRPGTLLPRPGESPADVLRALAVVSASLGACWRRLDDDQWSLGFREPDDNPDLGGLAISVLAILRLTEVEVHGGDLGLGLSEWSPTFVEVALAFRLDWLNRRRANHQAADADLHGSWLLDASDGPTYLIEVAGDAVHSGPVIDAPPVRAVLRGTSRDLLALLLGRPHNALAVSGDRAFAASFARAFPGP